MYTSNSSLRRRVFCDSQCDRISTFPCNCDVSSTVIYHHRHHHQFLLRVLDCFGVFDESMFSVIDHTASCSVEHRLLRLMQLKARAVFCIEFDVGWFLCRHGDVHIYLSHVLLSNSLFTQNRAQTKRGLCRIRHRPQSEYKMFLMLSRLTLVLFAC